MIGEFLRFDPLTLFDHDAGDLLPSLPGRYPVSSLLRSSPPLVGASVLSASRVHRLCLVPSHHRTGSQVPHQSPDWSHATSTPDIAWPVASHPPRFSRSMERAPALMPAVSFEALSVVSLRSSLQPIHDAISSRLFRERSPPPPLDGSSSRLFEACSWKPAPKGPLPSSLVQHRAPRARS